MQILLTHESGDTFSLEASVVLFVRPAAGKILTSIVTSIRNPQGQLESFTVKENSTTVARMINMALLAMLDASKYNAAALGFENSN